MDSFSWPCPIQGKCGGRGSGCAAEGDICQEILPPLTTVLISKSQHLVRLWPLASFAAPGERLDDNESININSALKQVVQGAPQPNTEADLQGEHR
jgi:hypothetical protein